MKRLITLCAIIGISIFAFHTGQNVKTPHMSAIAHAEAIKQQKVDSVPVKAEKAPEVAEKKPEAPKQKAPTPEPVVEKAVETPPPPPPKPVSRGGCELAFNYDWPANTAKAICMAESSGVATKTNWSDRHHNCTGSYGLMQVGCFWFPYFGYSLDQAHDPVINMEAAYRIYKRGGSFSPWTTYTGGAYLKYL